MNPFEAQIDPLLTQVGDIILQDGKKYKIIKKTLTAISVVRYFWWNRLYEWIERKLS